VAFVTGKKEKKKKKQKKTMVKKKKIYGLLDYLYSVGKGRRNKRVRPRPSRRGRESWYGEEGGVV